MNVSQIVGKWYDKNKRDLPWRKTRDPYKIWLSEVILQQTRVNQGLDYYLRFIENYPTINDLANASDDEVMRLWQGLGYYTRARNMHKAAVEIRDLFKGNFPSDYSEIRKLKGIGDYTAAAIASMAYDKPYPVVDGNVYRFLSRYYAIDTPIDTSAGKKIFYRLAGEIIDQKNPGHHNQSVMEFGAIVCLPKNPLCDVCPLSESCSARANNTIKTFPVKTKRTKIVERYFNYLVIRSGNTLHIRKRQEGDIWALLYEFPYIETSVSITGDELLKRPEIRDIFRETNFTLRHISKEYRHQLTHQRIFARFAEIECAQKINGSHYIHVSPDQLDDYAMPRLIEKYLQDTVN